MRLSWLIMMAACGSMETAPQAEMTDGQWLRGVDTADSGLVLDPQCADPGFCGCDYVGYDLEAPVGDETCVHTTATVLGDISAGATVEAGAVVALYASVGPGATLGTNAFMAARSTVHEDAIIGANVTIGRSATIGARADIGDDSMIGRSATVGEDVDASVGMLTMGYASFLGDRSIITGTNVVLGNLVTIGADSEIAAGVVVARGATFGDLTTLGQNVVVGPGVSALDGVTIGQDSRIRKGVMFANDVTLGTGVRVGRDSELREGSTIADGATLRTDVTVGTFYDVEANAYIPRGTVLEDQAGPSVSDQDPIVVITSPIDGADSDSGSLTITGTVDDDFGVTSVTVRVDGGTPISIPFSGGQFTHTVTGIPDLSQTIQVTAFDASGNEGSDILYVSDCNPSTVSMSHTWTGATNSDWNTASNWSSNTVPSTSSTAFVCGDTPTQPQLAADTTLAGLYMDWDANLASDGHTLTMTSVYSGGITSGTGTVQANTNVLIKGTVPNFVVNGDVFLSGVTVATGNTSIGSGVRRLRIGPHSLRIDGNYTQSISGSDGGLYLREASSRVSIGGSASFGGTTNMNTTSASPMLNGEIQVQGDFIMPCSTSRDCFRPIGTHIELNGSSPQALTITGGGTSGSYFYSVDMKNPAGVTATGTVYASHSLSVTNGGQFNATNLTTGSNAAINELSGNAVLTISGITDFAGSIDVRDTSTLAINTLNSRAFFNMSPESTLTGTIVNLYGEFVIPSDNYTPTTTFVRADMDVLNDWDHKMPLLSIPSGGRLRIGAHDFDLDGNYTQAISGSDGGLYMRDAASDVNITGYASFGGTTSMNTTSASPMLDGIIKVQGDFILPCSTSRDCFRPIGTHVQLDGTTPQALSVSGGGTSGSYFYSLDIKNPVGVTAAGTLYASHSFSVTSGGEFSATNVATGTTAATNEFSGDAELNITGTADFAGSIDVQDTSTLAITTLNARSFFNMSPPSFYSGTTVNLYGEFVVPSDNYTPTTTHVRTDMFLLSDWDHQMPLLSIPSGGRLRIGTHNFDLTGNYTQAISGTDGGLYLRDVGSNVNITGNASFGGTTSMNTTAASPMLAGTIAIQGNMTLPCSTSSDCFRPIGTHVILNGTSPQTLTFSGGGTSGSYLYSLDVQNPMGVTMTGVGYASHSLSVTNGGQFSATNFLTGNSAAINEFSGNAVVDITGTADFAGTIDVQDTSTLNIHTLNARSFFNMSPPSVYSGTTVNMYGQLVIPSDNYTPTTTHIRADTFVQGNWDHKMPLLSVPSGGRLRVGAHTVHLDGNYTQSISGSDGGLYMRDAASDVTITGSATFGGTTSMNTTAASPMLDGTITVQGDVILPCSTSSDCYRSVGTRVIMDGTAPQALTIAGGGTSGSYFHSLELANTGGTTIAGTLYASSDIDITGVATYPTGTATTNADLTIDGGTLNNSGTFRYNNTFTTPNGGTVVGNTPVNF